MVMKLAHPIIIKNKKEPEKLEATIIPVKPIRKGLSKEPKDNPKKAIKLGGINFLKVEYSQYTQDMLTETDD